MQDEIAKHGKKIYSTVKSHNSFNEKLKEVIVEIFIIVFAVTLSIWLHSWSEHKHEAEKFLMELKSDIESTDIPLTKIEATIGTNQVDVNLSGPYVGIRAFGFALGIKF